MERAALILGLFVMLLRLSVSQQTANDWFDSLNVRDTPLVLCPTHGEGNYFRVPSLPECTPPEEKESSVIFLTTYWAVQPDPFEGFECFKHTFDNVIHSPCLGNILCQSLHQIENEKYEPLTVEECSRMKIGTHAPNGEFLENLGGGLRGLKNNIMPEEFWFGAVSITNVNYYIQQRKLSVTPEEGSIKVFGTTLTKSCNINDEHCPSEKGIVIWEKTMHAPCSIKIGKTTPCLKTGEIITCEMISSTFHGWTVTEMCGEKVLKAGSGTLFTTNTSYEIHDDVSSHADIMERIQHLLPLHLRRKQTEGTLQRNKREVAGIEMADIAIVTYKEYQNHMNYLLTIIDNEMDEVRRYHVEQCKENRMHRLVHMSGFEEGKVSGLVVGLTGDKSIRGILAGDVINIWACHNITIYRFLSNSKCTMEAPVKYEFMGEVHDGWVRPFTKTLVSTPQIVPCPTPPFHFQLNNGTVIQTRSRAMLNNIPTLPDTGSNPPFDKKDPLIFTPEIILDWSDISGKKDDDAEREARDANRRWGNLMASLRRGERPKQEEEELFKFLSGLFNIPYLETCVSILMIVLVIAIAIAAGGPILLSNVISVIAVAFKRIVGTLWFLVFGVMMRALVSIRTACGKKQEPKKDNYYQSIVMGERKEIDEGWYRPPVAPDEHVMGLGPEQYKSLYPRL